MIKLLSQSLILSTLLVSVALCSTALADPTWLCAITSAVAVDEDGTVGPPDLGGQQRPTFFRVDIEKKEVTLLAPESRRGEVTKIEAVREGEGMWVLSGIENARAWSLIITAKGYMSLSVTGDGVVWSVFGHAVRDNGIVGEQPVEQP